MRFRAIATTRELNRWLDVTDRIYRGGGFLPPIRQAVRAIFRSASDRFGVKVAFYVVEDEQGCMLARTTVHSSDAFDAKLGYRVQLFGFTEFVERYDVFETLMTGVQAIAGRAGRTLLFGPANLLPNECGGVIASGFGHPGFLDGAYNAPYYAGFYRNMGFEPRFPSSTFICDSVQSGPDPDAVLRFDATRMQREQLEIRHADRRRLGEELVMLQGMLNASFAARPYYTPIPLDELQSRMAGLAYLLDERLLVYLLRAGQPVAFVVCLPDISRFLARTNGALGPLRQVQLLLTRGRYRREAIFVVAGVVPPHSGAGYLGLLMREVFRNLRAGGYQAVRWTSIEQDNPRAHGTIRAMQGRAMHDVAYYQRAV